MLPASAACPSTEATQLDQLALAHDHRANDRLKSAVMSARGVMKAKGGSELAKDAALLLVADVYFDEVGRHENASTYYEYLDGSPLAGAGLGRRAVILQHQGDAKGAKKALRHVPDWKHSTEPDVIWARHALGHTDQAEALASLDAVRARYQAITTTTDAEALGGAALTVTTINDPELVGCEHAEVPAEVSSVESGVARLLRRVDLAVVGVETGKLPEPSPPKAPSGPSLRQRIEELSRDTDGAVPLDESE